MRPTRYASTFLAALTVATAAAGCGSDDAGTEATPAAAITPAATVAPAETAAAPDAAAGGPTTRLKVSSNRARPVRYDKKTLRARAGKVVIAYRNNSALLHNIAIKGNGIRESSLNSQSGQVEVSAVLEPGRYRFFCSVPHHEEAGMFGTLIVR